GIPQLQKDAIYNKLGNLSAETVLNRYEALHHKCKTIRDKCEETGGGGLEDCLAQERITRGLYDEMLEFMGSNAAFNAEGGTNPGDAATDEDEGEQSDSIDAGSNGAESDGSGSDGEERDNEEVSQGISREPHWNGSGSTSLDQVGINASLFESPSSSTFQDEMLQNWMATNQRNQSSTFESRRGSSISGSATGSVSKANTRNSVSKSKKPSTRLPSAANSKKSQQVLKPDRSLNELEGVLQRSSNRQSEGMMGFMLQMAEERREERRLEAEDQRLQMLEARERRQQEAEERRKNLVEAEERRQQANQQMMNQQMMFMAFMEKMTRKE
ncbi:UNVERIFIED_CONTAM: hypothetical protein HDU68_002038, partial [Siphonaria sp. JEL0065]